jgi:hypothetical protein
MDQSQNVLWAAFVKVRENLTTEQLVARVQSRSDPRMPVIVCDSVFTSVDRDLKNMSGDRFKNMKAAVPSDTLLIQSEILKHFDSGDNLNFLMKCFTLFALYEMEFHRIEQILQAVGFVVSFPLTVDSASMSLEKN